MHPQARDGLRIDNTKLKHKAGLLGNKPLLKDYEVRKDEGEELQVNNMTTNLFYYLLPCMFG